MKAETDSPFSDQILSEKLLKLNNSQQSIQTLSRWCISHRKKARLVVETWEQQFIDASKEQKVPFLYLANDILQNSKRDGNEFVNEFWKVLPRSLKLVCESGEESPKKVVTRLIDIWDERKVFGSRGRSLKADVLSEDAPRPASDNNGRSANPVKVVKKDSSTIRIKLAVGGMPEKIISAFQSVSDGHFTEDAALNKCKTSISSLERIAKDATDPSLRGALHGSLLISDLQEEELILRRCVEQLEGVESTRQVLVDQLKQALREQETKSELVRVQLQAARAGSERAVRLWQQLSSDHLADIPNLNSRQAIASLTSGTMPIGALFQQPATSPIGTAVDNVAGAHKKALEAMATKLTASSSSAQVLTSIISSLAAQEAASKSSGLGNGPPGFPADKRPRLEDGSNSYFSHVQPQQVGINQTATSFAPPLPPALPPHLQLFRQATGGAAMTTPQFTIMASNTLQPPPRMILPHLPSSVHLPSPMPTAGFPAPSGIGFDPSGVQRP